MQIFPMAAPAWAIGSADAACSTAACSLLAGRIREAAQALSSTSAHRAAPAQPFENCRATRPNRKAGPGRLQKPRSISASRFCSAPRFAAWAMQAAPAG